MAQIIDPAEGIAPRPRRKQEGDIDITPMIDIVFLLLAFFVIVSKMDPAAAVKLPQARHGVSVPEASCVTLVVSESDTDTPLVYRGKAKNASDKFEGSVEDISLQITDYVEEQLQTSAEKTTVLIKGERKVKSRHVALVKDAVSQAVDVEAGHEIHYGIEEE